MEATRFKLHGALVLTQFLFAGFEIFTRTALFEGANQIVFTLYRNVLACIILLPAAYFLERTRRPALSFSSASKLFCIGLLGVTINQVLYLFGLKNTSTVFASAMRNLVPIFTFVLAAILRVEEVKINRKDGVAKVAGSLIGLCGAILLSAFHPSFTTPVVQGAAPPAVETVNFFNIKFMQITRWELGSVCLVLSFFAFAVSLILQSSMLEKYPAPLSIGGFSCLASTLQLGAISAIFTRDISSWKLEIEEIFSVLYAGAIGSGIVSGIQSWGVQKGGPVIVAAYQPLETVAVTIFYIFTGDTVLLTSLLGIAMVIAGLYLLTWGQEEQRKRSEVPDSKEPLLLNETLC